MASSLQHTDALIDVAALRGDVYRLAVLLYAERSIIEVDALRILWEDHHDREVNRLLIWIAIASRQLLDIDDSTASERCGRICRGTSGDKWSDLSFRHACNAVIHAVEIIPYDPDDIEEGESRACYNGRIAIRGRGRRKGADFRAVMEFEKIRRMLRPDEQHVPEKDDCHVQ